MFVDIALTNRENIARRLDLYIAELEALRAAVAAGDPGLKDWFERARELHNDWLAGRAQGGSQAEDNPLPSGRQLLTGTLFGRLGGGGPRLGTLARHDSGGDERVAPSAPWLGFDALGG